MSRLSVDDSYRLFPPGVFIFPLSRTPIHVHTHFGGYFSGAKAWGNYSSASVCICFWLSPWLSGCTDRIAWKLQFYLWLASLQHSFPFKEKISFAFLLQTEGLGSFLKPHLTFRACPGAAFLLCRHQKEWPGGGLQRAVSSWHNWGWLSLGLLSPVSFTVFANQGPNFHKYGLLLKLWHTCWWAGLAGDERSKHFNLTRLHHFSSMSFKLGFGMDIRPATQRTTNSRLYLLKMKTAEVPSFSIQICSNSRG